MRAGTDGKDAQKRAAQGFDMISVATDVGVLGGGMMRELETASGSEAKAEDATDKSGGYS